MKENIKEIREKKLEQLYKDLATLNKELREVRFKVANREIKDLNQKKKIRTKIAQVWTIIREKEYESISNKVE